LKEIILKKTCNGCGFSILRDPGLAIPPAETQNKMNDPYIKNTLYVKVETKYGNKLVYPNCCLSAAFTRLINKKTLPAHAVKEIKAMGFKFEVKSEEL